MFDTFAGSSDSSTPTSRFVEGGSAGSGSVFGGVSSYGTCGCCGTFHAMQAGAGGPGILLNADDRGGFGPNGKPSLSPTDAGAQITRTNARWGSGGMGTAANVTFSFRSTAASMPSDTAGFTQFTTLQINATLLALASWSDVANITFTRVNDSGSEYSNNATIVFGNYSSGADGAAAFAYLPGNSTPGLNAGDVWVNNSLAYNATPVMQGYGQLVLVHEIGHAIGLSHPAAYNASAGVTITYTDHATYFEDSLQFTVMSYFDETWTGAQFGSGRYPASVLLDDIAAAQRLYGANMATRTGDTVYGFGSTADRAWYNANNELSELIFAVWDAGGTDTLNFSGYSDNQLIDLRQGNYSSVGGLVGNVAIALGAVIENAVGGSGIDVIHGNSAGNRITGGLGNDAIDAGLGTDTVVFSGLRSAYTITWNGQTATVVGPDGSDTVINAEFLAFDDMTIATTPTGGLSVSGDITAETITGTSFADTIAAAGGNDTVNGLGGNDTLGGGTGDDTLSGGDDNDTLIGGLGDDTLNGGAGIDAADYSGAGAAVTVNLGTGLATGGGGNDTLSLIEDVTGSAYNDTLTGDNNANTIRGGGGIDTINGGGGTDILYAGAPGEGGGADDITKQQSTANASIGTAVSLTGGFDLRTRTGVNDASTIPHATVVAVTHGGVEYYAITVTAGEMINIDIDSAGFDSVLRVLDGSGAALATNDDGVAVGEGGGTDSFISFTFGAAGTYYIEVSQWVSGSGASLVTGPPSAGGSYTMHVSSPSQTAQPIIFSGSTLNGDAGADTLFGGTGVDTLTGGEDNDVLIGGAGSDVVSGGNGYDIAGYSGVRRAYAASATSVSGNGEGTDTLSGIEDLAFTDGRLTFARDGQAAQVMRLYDAAFNRNPDQSGFEALLDTLENSSLTLLQLADEFINSTEFQTQYAGLTNQQFVEQLYQFCLNRAGDTGGVNTWVAALNGGMSRGAVLLAFSESGEHKDLLQGQLDAGLWVADEQTLQIARLYDATYDRLPDQGGLATWRNALGGGMSLLSIAQAFTTAPEFQARYGALSNQAFVELMYQLCLNRNGDASGIQTWTDALNGGMSRGEVLMFFSESSEHVALTRPTWLGGVPCIDVAAPSPVLPDDKQDGDGAQVIPATADAGADGEDGGAQVLPGAEQFAEGKVASDTELGPQVLPGAADDTGATGKDADAQVLPGVIDSVTDDGFLLAKDDAELGPQVLPGAEDDMTFLFDLGGDTVDAGHDLPGLEHRLAMLFLETGEHAPGADTGPLDQHHNPDPWAA
jgi:Ca2+-binding RTX toxin-like protein